MMDAFLQHLVKNVHRVAVVRPRADLDGARLLVEREELDVDRTQAFVDRRRLPVYEAVGMDGHLGDLFHREVAVSATDTYTHSCWSSPVAHLVTLVHIVI